MSADEELWNLLASIEEQLPLQRDTLEALFGASFKGTVDHNRQPILVATTPRFELELRAPSGPSQGHLTVRFTPPWMIGAAAVVARFPGGHSVPPPPPGLGMDEAEGAYIANRPWGQIWFAFYTGGRLVHMSIAPGQRGSPGV